ncbi:MAG: hypothetical protein SFU25_03885 [Candidatus Caenarcaniphilales bacterium]|nr:hypothetical protein [Candidatus Caenarcaniphilales bacterium]
MNINITPTKAGRASPHALQSHKKFHSNTAMDPALEGNYPSYPQEKKSNGLMVKVKNSFQVAKQWVLLHWKQLLAVLVTLSLGVFAFKRFGKSGGNTEITYSYNQAPAESVSVGSPSGPPSSDPRLVALQRELAAAEKKYNIRAYGKDTTDNELIYSLSGGVILSVAGIILGNTIVPALGTLGGALSCAMSGVALTSVARLRQRVIPLQLRFWRKAAQKVEDKITIAEFNTAKDNLRNYVV